MQKLSLLLLLAASVAVVAVSSVSAHSRPIRFDPAPGAVLDAAPAEITGWFTSDLRRVDGSYIHVRDEAGDPVHTGEVELSTDRRQMSTALQAGLGEGRYLVHWSTFDDADGEVFSACYTFFVGQAAADAAVENGVALDGGAGCTDASGQHTGEEVPADAASISISIPSVSESDTVTLEIVPANFTPRAPDGSTIDPNFGHYHIYLDKVPVDVLMGEHGHEDADGHDDDPAGSTGAMDDDHEDDSANSDHATTENPGGLEENPIMWVENSYTFTHLEPGYHTVSVVLNYDDHTSFSPPVIASETFRVEGGSDSDSTGIPAWALALGVIGGLVVGGAGMKLLGPRA